MRDVAAESKVFGYYFLRQSPDKKTATLYKKALQQLPAQPSKADTRLINYAVAHSWSVGFIDAGLAITGSESVFRQRLHVMFAIIEANNKFYKRFLPRRRGPFYILYVFFVGIRGLLKAMFGLVLVKLILAKSDV